MQTILASMLVKSSHKLAPIIKDSPLQTILCITTAANVYQEKDRTWQYDEMAILRQLGIRLDTFDIAGKSPAEAEAKLNNHIAVYITGGNTYYLLEQMQKSGFLEKLQTWATSHGELYLGCSAGAAMACPRIDYIGDMDDITITSLTNFSGLGFFDKFVMPHADNPKFQAKARQLMNDWHKTSHAIIPLNDDQLLIWDGKEERIL